MLRLHLLAHAPTLAQRRFRFPADESIEPIDPAVIQRLSARLGSRGVAWRGPERRSAETAAALGRVATICPDLRAWSAGDWAGQPLAQVIEDDPEGFRAWRTSPDTAPAGGESLRALLERVGSWLETQTPGARPVLIVADPAVIRAALIYVLDAGPQAFWRLEVPPLSLSIVQYANGEWRLRHLNIE